jgi:hypothetical protein
MRFYAIINAKLLRFYFEINRFIRFFAENNHQADRKT